MKTETTRAVKRFSQKIKQKRYELNISQQRLADVTDVHVNTINNIERGVMTPNLVIAMRISKALKISLDEVLNDIVFDLYW